MKLDLFKDSFYIYLYIYIFCFSSLFIDSIMGKGTQNATLEKNYRARAHHLTGLCLKMMYTQFFAIRVSLKTSKAI